MLQEGYVHSDGVRLHYVDWDGPGRAVVLLAGLTRRGHGRSDRPEAGQDLDTLVDDIHSFVEGLGFERAVLIGRSFAGISMPGFATHYPHRVDGIICLDAIFPILDPKPDLSGDPVWSVPPARLATLRLGPAWADARVRSYLDDPAA
jgi:pimeloyl-ACP methyl ester carboxylesterase